ncbi:14739_t:CDS:1, partial [Racocetra fulgida]
DVQRLPRYLEKIKNTLNPNQTTLLNRYNSIGVKMIFLETIYEQRQKE